LAYERPFRTEWNSMREALDSLKRPAAHGFSVLACFVNATTSDPNSREEIGDGAGGIAPILAFTRLIRAGA
jgi:hypothetical protein